MRRQLIVVTLLLLVMRASMAPAQTLGVLHIKAILTSATGSAQPVPRHALLISDNPATAAPRLVRTGADGTVDVRLPKGNYTVESEMPLTFGGNNFQWMQNVDVVPGRDVVLELTEANAEMTRADGDTTSTAVDSSLTLARWYDSVVAIWTPTTRATGFLIDRRGLIVTNRRGVTPEGLEAQLTPSVKVAARLLAADAERDIAFLWVNPQIVASITPLSLGCGNAIRPPVEDGQRVYAVEAPLRQEKGSLSGKVRAVSSGGIATDLSPSTGGSGSPAFTEDGQLLGMISTRGDERRNPDAFIVLTSDLCDVLSIAESAIGDGPPPSAVHLPVERRSAVPGGVPGIARPSANDQWPHKVVAKDFDVALITPPMLMQDRNARPQSLPVRGGGVASAPARTLVDPLAEFGSWSDYVVDVPPVLLVRVTPKFTEGLWTRVARAAAYTQGAALPPITRLTPGFLKLRAFCGETEITPIHPFRIEQRVSETTATHEGLYAFEPGAFAPSCASVSLQLYSEKEPEKGETVVVPGTLVEQVWQELSPYRRSP